MVGALSGYVIGVTADRRSDEQISLLVGRGAECLHGPSIRTHPLRPEAEIRAATEAFLCNPPDVVVLSTGIGVRGWLEAADSILLGEELRAVLGRCDLVSRGPKARGAAITADLDVTWNAPNATSTEVVEYLKGRGLNGTRVAVQLDGAPGNRLSTLLADLGAEVLAIPVYRWSLPEDVGPAQALIRAACDGRVDAITFTARPAVENFVEIAVAMGRVDDLVAACVDRVRLFCIGPVCAAGVTESGLGAPLQPERARLGALVMYITTMLGDDSSGLLLGGHEISVQGRMVSVPGQEPALLSLRERQLLDVLTRRPGVVYSKPLLLREVWDSEESDGHVVEVTIGRLRRRLGPAGVGIETVIRRGYRASPA